MLKLLYHLVVLCYKADYLSQVAHKNRKGPGGWGGTFLLGHIGVRAPRMFVKNQFLHFSGILEPNLRIGMWFLSRRKFIVIKNLGILRISSKN